MDAHKQEKETVIEVAMIGGNVLVTFADGRIAMLKAHNIYLESTDPPPDPDAE